MLRSELLLFITETGSRYFVRYSEKTIERMLGDGHEPATLTSRVVSWEGVPHDAN